MIELLDISTSQLNGKSIHNVSITILEGECHAVVGFGGAGKSIIAELLCGRIPFNKYSGSIKIDGETVKFRSVEDAMRKRIAFAPQDLNLIPSMTVCENLMLGSIQFQKDWIIDWDGCYNTASGTIKQLRPDISLDTPVESLKLGGRQIVKLSRALMLEPRILILDEITDGMTEQEIHSIMQIIAQFKDENRCILYLTRDVELALMFSDHLTALMNGSVMATDTTENLTKDKVLDMISGRGKEQFNSLEAFTEKYSISEREKDILDDLIRGLTNKQISSNRYISINTVKTHIANIYSKISVDSRVALINKFFEFSHKK